MAFQLDQRLMQDPQAGREQLIWWLKDGQLRVVLGKDGVPYAEGDLLPLVILSEASSAVAENTKPANHLAGRYVHIVAGDDVATLATWIESLFRLIVCVE